MKLFELSRKTDEFENRVIGGVHATRWIASWYMVGGRFDGVGQDQFIEWLMSNGVSEDDAYLVRNLATCGRLEQQASAAQFLEDHPRESYGKVIGDR